MTVDDRDGPPRTEGECTPPDERRPVRATSARGGPGGLSQRRDLERYAALFASRTSVMKSSAMRDLMAITERPEVISLAGGLPDTSTFPAESLAALLSKLAASDSARALQYAPTEGMAAVGEAIATVMAAEGMDDDGMRVDELEETLARLDREGRRPKFIYTIPTFQNPAGVTLSLPRRQRLVQVAKERELLVLEDNPYGLLRYEGDPLPTLRSLDGGEFVIYLGTFSKILSPGIRLGWTVAPGPVLEKMNLGKQASDLCSSAMTQFFVATYFAHDRWQDYLRSLRELYRRRRDTMLDALAEHLPREARWASPEGGLFIWVTLPDYIDTTDLLARALSRNVAFVPGRAAFTDGRGGSSMRLNFSGVGDDDIREGVRRIGEVVREQVGLYGTLTGARPDEAPATGDAAPRAADPGMADVLELPRRRRGDRRSDA